MENCGFGGPRISEAWSICSEGAKLRAAHHPRLIKDNHIFSVWKILVGTLIEPLLYWELSYFSWFSNNALSLKFSPPFSRWRTRGSERLRNLPKVTQRASPRGRLNTGLLPKPLSIHRMSLSTDTCSCGRFWSTWWFQERPGHCPLQLQPQSFLHGLCFQLAASWASPPARAAPAQPPAFPVTHLLVCVSPGVRPAW